MRQFVLAKCGHRRKPRVGIRPVGAPQARRVLVGGCSARRERRLRVDTREGRFFFFFFCFFFFGFFAAEPSRRRRYGYGKFKLKMFNPQRSHVSRKLPDKK